MIVPAALAIAAAGAIVRRYGPRLPRRAAPHWVETAERLLERVAELQAQLADMPANDKRRREIEKYERQLMTTIGRIAAAHWAVDRPAGWLPRQRLPAPPKQELSQ